MMTKEEWIEMYRRCENTIRYYLTRGDIKQAQRYDWLKVEILHRIDDMGGLDSK